MKISKRIFAFSVCAVLIATVFTGCSGNKEEKYSDETLIIGYTDAVAPFLNVDKDGKVGGFSAALWKKIFNDVKGECKNYRFEKIEEGYELEESGGFTDSKKKEYSAALLMGAVSKNNGTFNEDYSFTEPIITNRVIALSTKDSKRTTYGDFEGARVLLVSSAAQDAFFANKAIADSCKSATKDKSIANALAKLSRGEADIVVADEFSLNAKGTYSKDGATYTYTDSKEQYTVFSGELDKIEYVIACAKYSGWKDSINEAIRELKSDQYGNGDEFTPIVEKYFGYNASSFEYTTDGDK